MNEINLKVLKISDIYLMKKKMSLHMKILDLCLMVLIILILNFMRLNLMRLNILKLNLAKLNLMRLIILILNPMRSIIV